MKSSAFRVLRLRNSNVITDRRHAVGRLAGRAGCARSMGSRMETASYLPRRRRDLVIRRRRRWSGSAEQGAPPLFTRASKLGSWHRVFRRSADLSNTNSEARGILGHHRMDHHRAMRGGRHLGIGVPPVVAVVAFGSAQTLRLAAPSRGQLFRPCRPRGLPRAGALLGVDRCVGS